MIKRTTKWLCIVLFLLVLFTLSACEEWDDTSIPQTPPNSPATLDNNDFDKGVVVYVIDGDTFEVELENGQTERVRPILVNTPEICHESSPTDCEAETYGKEAFHQKTTKRKNGLFRTRRIRTGPIRPSVSVYLPGRWPNVPRNHLS